MLGAWGGSSPPVPRRCPAPSILWNEWARSFLLSLSLFLSAGLRGRCATRRHLARPTTLLFIERPALGYSRVWQRIRGWLCISELLPPALNTKQRHNPRLISAPLWPNVSGLQLGLRSALPTCRTRRLFCRGPRYYSNITYHIHELLYGGFFGCLKTKRGGYYFARELCRGPPL